MPCDDGDADGNTSETEAAGGQCVVFVRDVGWECAWDNACRADMGVGAMDWSGVWEKVIYLCGLHRRSQGSGDDFIVIV